jgi:hypothetical protein
MYMYGLKYLGSFIGDDQSHAKDASCRPKWETRLRRLETSN